jgi:hypothetical protein
VEKLPKFIISEGDSREQEDQAFPFSYVMHCHEPRFLMRFMLGDEDDIFLMDSTDDEEMLIGLMNRARKFFYEKNPSLRP